MEWDGRGRRGRELGHRQQATGNSKVKGKPTSHHGDTETRRHGEERLVAGNSKGETKSKTKILTTEDTEEHREERSVRANGEDICNW